MKKISPYDLIESIFNPSSIPISFILQNTEIQKKNPNKYGYDVYEEQFNEFGEQINRNILGKYDEEIDGIKATTFSIGENLQDERDRKRRLLEVNYQLLSIYHCGPRMNSIFLFLDQIEIGWKEIGIIGRAIAQISLRCLHWRRNCKVRAKQIGQFNEETKIIFLNFIFRFKKPKKKVKKLRQKLKADDLLPLSGPGGSSSKDFGKRLRVHHDVDTDDVNDTDFKDIKIEEEDNELEKILSKTRRLKQKESLISKSLAPEETDTSVKMEMDSDDENGDITSKDNNICLNATAEFCRTLGDIPTYGMSGNRDEDAGDMMDFEQEILEPDEPIEEKRNMGGTWNSVNPDLEAIVEDKSNEMTEVAILDEEPDVGSGMGAALKLALSKGYLEREESNRPSNTRMAHLQAKNYSIEDKAYAWVSYGES